MKLCKAVIVAVHGLSGAAIDFEPLGHHLAPQGFATYAVELRGQGSDPMPSRRGDLKELKDWFEDLHAFLDLVRGVHPGVPIFLYGESMGAAILTHFLAQAPPSAQPRGLILASPVTVLPQEAPAWQQLLFRLLFLVHPRLRLNVRKLTKPRKGALPAYVTRDAAHRKWFETASHRVDSYTIRFFKNLHDLIKGCAAAAPSLTIPTLVIYAGHDVFITPARVEEFIRRIGDPGKESEFFADSYHLLLNDDDRPRVLARIDRWLEDQLSSRGAICEETRAPYIGG